MARDITEDTSRRSALVLAPHADDETIACGATIARKVAAGSPVHVVVAADGHDALRRAECREACRRLGLDDQDVTFLGLPDGALGENPEALDAQLLSILDAFRPDDVFAPSGIDAHPDHRSLAAAVERLGPGALRHSRIFGYPVWFWNRWAWVDRATPRWRQTAQLIWRPLADAATVRTRIVRTAPFAEVKLYALDAHRSQVDEKFAGPGQKALDPEWLAMFLGSEELFFRVQEPSGGAGS
jgi:LmbE family N-acetylglucosaminyl deacetylase